MQMAVTCYHAQNFKKILETEPSCLIPDALNKAFITTDTQLIERKGMHSGCTAVVAYLALEERAENGIPVTVNSHHEASNIQKRVLYTANVGDARIVLRFASRCLYNPKSHGRSS